MKQPIKVNSTIRLTCNWLEQIPEPGFYVMPNSTFARKTTRAEVRKVLAARVGTIVVFQAWCVYSGDRSDRLSGYQRKSGSLKLGCTNFTPAQAKIIAKWARRERSDGGNQRAHETVGA